MKTYKGMTEEQLKQYARDNNITHCVRELVEFGISLREALINCYEANEFAKKFRKENK